MTSENQAQYEMYSLYPRYFAAPGVKYSLQPWTQTQESVYDLIVMDQLLRKHGYAGYDLSQVTFQNDKLIMQDFTGCVNTWKGEKPVFGWKSKYPFKYHGNSYDQKMLNEHWGQDVLLSYFKSKFVGGVESSDDHQLGIEFSRYLAVQKITTFAPGREYLNIFERLMITYANDQHQDDVDPLFDNRKITPGYFALDKMQEELKFNKINIGDKINVVIKNWIDNVPNINMKININLKEQILQLNDQDGNLFVYIFPADLLQALLSRCNLVQISIICLRYACTLQQAQQWSNSPQFYKIITQVYHADIEGFASPLNTRIILASDETKFCSMFPDVDQVAGSLGSFFTNEFTGHTITVCPPYTIYLFDEILRKIKEHMSRQEVTRFILGIADWPDIDLIQYLEKSPYTKFKHITKKNEHYFIDTKYDCKMLAPFQNRYYVVSNETTKEDYSPLARMFDNIKRESGQLLKLRNLALKNRTYKFDYVQSIEDASFVANVLLWNNLAKHLFPAFNNPSQSVVFHYFLTHAIIEAGTGKQVEQNIKKYIHKHMNATFGPTILGGGDNYSDNVYKTLCKAYHCDSRQSLNTQVSIDQLFNRALRGDITEEEMLAQFSDMLKKLPLNHNIRNSDNYKIDFITSLLGTNSVTSVLDVGAGSGKIVEALGRHYQLKKNNIYAIDLQLIQNNNITILGYDSENRIPLKSGSIDVVLMLSLLHHIEPEDRISLLAEVKRVLSPSGRIMIREHDDNKKNEFRLYIQMAHYVWYNAKNEMISPLHMMTKSEFRNMMTEAGFVNIQESSEPGNNPQRIYNSVYELMKN